MDYDQWCAGDSNVLLLSGPNDCALDSVSSHISGLMEEGRFGRDRIVLSFFSPKGATREGRPIGGRGSEETVFVHTLLHQLISSESESGKPQMSTASDFLRYLLGTIDNFELMARFENVSRGAPLAVIREALKITDRRLFGALGKVLEREEGVGIIVNVLEHMSGGGGNLLTAVSAFIGSLSEETRGIKVLLTCGPMVDAGKALGGLHCIKIQYDTERKGLITISCTEVRNVANECRMP
jgi:hypothetical protein